AITIPVGLGPRGMPLGLQIVGGAGHDDELLSVAAGGERGFPFAGLPGDREPSGRENDSARDRDPHPLPAGFRSGPNPACVPGTAAAATRPSPGSVGSGSPARCEAPSLYSPQEFGYTEASCRTRYPES